MRATTNRNVNVVTGNRPPPLPGAGYPRQSQVGVPVAQHDEHPSAFAAVAITPNTQVSAPAHVTWKAAVVLVSVTAAAVAWGVRQLSRLDASETNASKALAEIVEVRKAVEALKPEAIRDAAFARLLQQVKAKSLIADCPTQTVRGVSTKPCPIIGLVDQE